MHIAYVCTDPGIPVWGAKGASVHVQEMLRAFLRRGDRVTLMSPRLEGAPPADLGAVEVVALPPAPKGDPATRARALLAANEAVAEVLGRLAPDLVYERHALFAHAAMEWARGQGVPSILEVNAPLVDEQTAHRSLSLPDMAEASVRRAMRAAGLVAAVSAPIAKHAQAMGAETTLVVPNAVDPLRFPETQPRPGRPFTVGFLGSMKPWHGLPVLVEAFALLRREVTEARLLIVGDGPERASVEARAAALGLSDAMEITGLLPAAEVPAALSRMDVGTAPYGDSPSFYFSPLKLYEYFAAGLPVVASDTGHLAEIVAEGRTGHLVPPDDPAALAHVLAGLARAPDEAREMGRAGRAWVLANHTWDAMAERVIMRATRGRERAA
jgi:glycosyltransferase involved in cell wall biosynthesis